MYYKNMRLFYFCVFLIVSGNYAERIETNVDNLGVAFYEELGCTAIGNSSIPEGYKCPERPPGICVFGGQTYKHGEKIKKPTTCDVTCQCHVKGLNSFILCEFQVCDEKEAAPGCDMVHDLQDTCCKTKELCSSSNYTCEVEGEIYNEGELFYPIGTCLVCVCEKGFEGKFEQPFCRRDVYGVELFHPDEIASNCAPVYLSPRGSILCIPNQYICKKDLIDIQIKKSASLESKEKCDFSGNLFNQGDVIEVEYGNWPFSSKISCECLMPPQIVCFDFE